MQRDPTSRCCVRTRPASTAWSSTWCTATSGSASSRCGRWAARRTCTSPSSRMATVLLVGSRGQLAHDIGLVWQDERPGDRLIGLSHAELEVADAAAVRQAVLGCDPALVINTSAHHRVDAVEDDVDRAFQVNATGARNLAVACREADAVLLHVSTDYVFSGSGGRPYVE